MTREAWDPTPEQQHPHNGVSIAVIVVGALAIWTMASYLGSALTFVRHVATVVVVVVVATAVVNLLTKRT